MKQTVEMSEIISKILAGRIKFKTTMINNVNDEKTNDVTGTFRLLTSPIFRGANLLWESTNSVRLVLNNALLHADKAAVKTTKLITPAATFTPKALKT